jgi:hypothetical protein
MDWIDLVEDRSRWREVALIYKVINVLFPYNIEKFSNS